MKYTDLFTDLNKENIANCDQLVAPDIRFKDPFNDIRGIELFQKLLLKTLEEVETPVFNILDEACSKRCHYIRWDFEGKVRGLGALHFSGMSEVFYNEAQLVTQHIDHWDASEQFYEKIPVIGWPMACLKKRLKVS